MFIEQRFSEFRLPHAIKDLANADLMWHYENYAFAKHLQVIFLLMQVTLLTKQSSWLTGLLLPGWEISHTLTQPLPPV